MQNATYGIYKDGGIILDEPSFIANNSKVIVVSLENKPSKKAI